MQISIIIPAFNEQEVIVNTLNKVKSFLKNNFDSYEIIVVDDKSTDSTLNIINKIEGIKALNNVINHGKGYTVAKGVKVAQGDLILFMDADNSTDISELPKLRKYIDDYSLVIGSRGLKDSDVKISQPKIKELIGKAGRSLSQVLATPGIYDTQCGFKLFTKELKGIFDKITIEDFGFDLELIFLARKYNLKVKEVGITWYNHPDTTVKWYSYLKVLLDLFKIRFNNLIGKYN